ncbi:MAG TPA: hypothetical protein VMN56_14200 [Casimicrobiaceae bacterium]|nr:hypothetical protein [Casimicrobiaceae bacterium]
MVACPNCREPMTAKAEDAFAAVPRPVEIGCCEQCTVLWFDAFGSIRLTPKAVLELFQYIGQAGKARRTLASSFACPRCGGALALTHDVQRTTHFTYWRCPTDHGQLITFNQFLAQKNFIREPSPGELAKLRETVRQITCSQCGAPIDLATDSACTHCGAPVALIDPEGVSRALHDLSASQAAMAGDPSHVRDAVIDAQLAALLDREREGAGDDHDLLAIGAAAVGGLIGAWLSSRS